MKLNGLGALLAVGLSTFAALGAGKALPVCSEFPDWQGLDDKSYLFGNPVTASDLRHKCTLVIEFDPSKSMVSFALAARNLLMLTFDGAHMRDWMSQGALERDYIIVATCKDKVKDLLAAKKTWFEYKGDVTGISQALSFMRSSCSSGYSGVTFTGAPDNKGKLPYMYVLGPKSGKEIKFEGELNEDNAKKAVALMKKLRQEIRSTGENWEPNFGYLAEDSKYRAMIKAELAKKKPALQMLSNKILKDVTNKDTEVAKDAQLAYDALIQGRTEMERRIRLEAPEAPHLAKADMDELFRLWPSEKQKFKQILEKIKTYPAADQLYKIFSKIRVWSDPNFAPKNEGDAKKIVAELVKLKKMLEKLKESEIVIVQNGALLMDARIDELMGTIPTLVPSK